ncbi:MAG: DNA-binding response regulator [Anaerolineales bacterium]|nr:MAG: DNA-binding response regulator [Anaerolineales bacterium]
MIRVIIAEDHHMVRAGIRALLEKSGDIHVLAEAANGQDAIDLARELLPDVLIMDIMMPLTNGMQVAEIIHESKLPVNVLLLSMYADEGFVHQAMNYGVKGYVLKSSVSDELIKAVQVVADGQAYFSNPVSEIVAERAMQQHAGDKPAEDPLASLSPREKQIMQLIAEEHTNSEIARILRVSVKTVEKQRASLMEKLNVRNVAGLVRLAVKHHLIDPDL